MSDLPKGARVREPLPPAMIELFGSKDFTMSGTELMGLLLEVGNAANTAASQSIFKKESQMVRKSRVTIAVFDRVALEAEFLKMAAHDPESK